MKTLFKKILTNRLVVSKKVYFCRVTNLITNQKPKK